MNMGEAARPVTPPAVRPEQEVLILSLLSVELKCLKFPPDQEVLSLVQCPDFRRSPYGLSASGCGPGKPREAARLHSLGWGVCLSPPHLPQGRSSEEVVVVKEGCPL